MVAVVVRLGIFVILLVLEKVKNSARGILGAKVKIRQWLQDAQKCPNYPYSKDFQAAFVSKFSQ